MPTGDLVIRQTAIGSAPQAYTLPGGQELILRAVSATVDGTGASGAFVPCLVLVATDGRAVYTCPCQTTLSAGLSVDVSWFPTAE